MEGKENTEKQKRKKNRRKEEESKMKTFLVEKIGK
jgi:hypothetical protein